MNYDHVSATIGTRAVDPRMLADDKFLKRMGNFERVCKQIDAKHDHVMEMLANIQEQLRNLEMKQRRENGVKFCAGDAQFQNEKAAIKPTPSLSPLFSTFQPSPQTPPPPLLTTLKKPYSIETPSAKPLITALSSQIETLAILCTPKPQNIAMVVVNPKAIEPPLISSAYADITEGSNGALVIKEFHESSLDVSGNREKIETNLVEIGVQAMEEMSEWVVVSDSARSTEQTNPSREILQQIKASSDTKKTKCSQAIHLVKRITFNRSSISTETIHRFLSGQFLHSRILAEWAEEPPDIPNYQPSPFKGKPNTLQEKMAAKILVISPMLNVFDEMTERELSSSKEVTVCMDLGEKIHAHMKTDLYRVSVATSVEDFGKKCNEAMQVFDPGGSALDVRVLKVGDSLLEVFFASWLRIKWDSKKIYDWVWQSLFICSYVWQHNVWQHNLLKCSGVNREIVLCIVTSKSNIFGLVGCNICWFKTTCLVLCFKNLLAVTPQARSRRICFYTFMELTVWKWLKDGNGTCLQIDSLSLACLCEICDSLCEMLPTWNKHLGSDNLEMIIDDSRVAKYFLELRFEMGNSRAVFHLYCLINLELEKLMPLKTLLWLEWLLSAFWSEIYSEVCRISHRSDLAGLLTLDFESLKGGSSTFISFSNVFVGGSGSFGEGTRSFLEFIISFGSREFSVGVWMIVESLIKQRGDHSTMSRENKVDKMLDRPSTKPPFQFRHLSLGDKTLARGEYCHVHGYGGIGNKERRREINGSVGVLIMLGLDLIVYYDIMYFMVGNGLFALDS